MLKLFKIMISKSDLVSFWFQQKQHWFCQSDEFDSLIKTKYFKYLNYSLLKRTCEEYKTQEILISEKRNYLYLILLCDQIVRHCYRENKDMVTSYTNLVVELSLGLVKHDIFQSYTPEEQCFIMLPLRHSNKITYNQFILKKGKELYSEKNHAIYRRFYVATLKKLAQLKNNDAFRSIVMFDKSHQTIENIKHVLDDNSSRCIKYIPFKNENENEDLYKNINIINTLEEYIIKHKIRSFTISLSGGVDSMVLCYGLKTLQEKYKLDLQAIHINYNNRETSVYEKDLCVYWTYLLKIPIYVRSITEIKRTKDKDRDLYETITRDIRFGMYELLESSVVLGHNKDDKIENILTNIKKQRNYDNLFGMQEKHFDRVEICRPFLNITKSEIYDFARRMNIPFVYDSTPKWSERGKSRDILVPFLNSFDERILNGLESLSNFIENSVKMNQDFIKMLIHYEINFEDLKKNNTNVGPQTLATIHENILNYDENTWKLILTKICSKFKLPYINQKTYSKSFIKLKMMMLNKNKNKNKITLNLNMYVQIKSSIKIIYLNQKTY
jgi:tRNA(Ile)-lysidine synthetase-like protein